MPGFEELVVMGSDQVVQFQVDIDQARLDFGECMLQLLLTWIVFNHWRVVNCFSYLSFAVPA